MALQIPTTKELFIQYLANIEARINQTSPLLAKAFNRVISIVQAESFTVLYKVAVHEAMQVLAITATGQGLDNIGINYGVLRKEAEAAVLTIELPGVDTTIIPAGTDFVGDLNGVRYFSSASATITGGVASIDVTAEQTGVVGNLQVTDTLIIGTPVAGAESQATVTAIVNTGAERETDDAYRIRVLDQVRVETGGGNLADYRLWAQEVAGVARAYPFSGKPINDLLLSVPPDRTVYVEADTTIDPDGIAPQSLLDEVRDTVITDPQTGLRRPPMGLTDDTLFVESIFRTTFHVQISNLQVSSEVESQAQADIETALTNYFRGLAPFVDGLDSPLDRNDRITDLTVSNVVQDVLGAVGGTANSVAFGLTVGESLPEYSLEPGELAKLGSVTYV